MKITSVKYLTSVVDKEHILADGVPEFAFVGRSNVGKSSIINCLTGSKSIAKTSATPGKTKMINYFDVNSAQFRFVDLPGYGYAKVGKSHLDVWAGLMGEYLLNSTSLLTVFLLLDIRHLPTEQDRQMVKFLIYNHLPFCVLVTKGDKIAKSKQRAECDKIADSLGIRREMIILTSSETRQNREQVLTYIENKLEQIKK